MHNFSSASIMQAITSASSDVSAHLTTQKKLIYIPEKCYGIITPETSPDIRGLYTEGLHTCSAIVLFAKANGYFFLCHADAQTDLSDVEHGLKAWIAMIPEAVGNIELQYDNLGDYGSIIQEIMNELPAETKSRIHVIPQEVTGSIDLLILRTGSVLKNGAFNDFLVDGYERVASNIAQTDLWNIFHSYEDEARHPPLCVFNGQKILRLEDIIEQQDWVATALYPPDQDHLTAEEAAYFDEDFEETEDEAAATTRGSHTIGNASL